MMGHKIFFYEEPLLIILIKFIPATPSYLEHCIYANERCYDNIIVSYLHIGIYLHVKGKQILWFADCFGDWNSPFEKWSALKGKNFLL